MFFVNILCKHVLYPKTGQNIQILLSLSLSFIGQVSALAPAGYILVIEQAIGECSGDGTTRTEMYRISHEGKDGQRTIVG